MTNYYVGITSSNSYKFSLPHDNDLDTCISSYNSNGIKAVAIGRNDRFAIVSEGGGWRGRGPQTFLDKMKELHRNNFDTQNIKHITFGPDDTWAITMDNGWCYTRSYYDEDGGPHDAINEHNGKIKYVSMSHRDINGLLVMVTMVEEVED
eukprot:CAMPEP_0114680544 /NCGR_PEP_ID=MMETSP0191-20121206/54282_1 /TAXON_ID=126664 /ORGANISM="Sorites sp." /LENGTH=149 /DNA_ID=CAMNT_0001957529 /DNA_START=48 /DNA_END=498 /DNA_ORIENTATION=+